MECDKERTNAVSEKSRNRLKSDISRSVTELFKNILDFVEVGIGDPSRYNALRKKILRVANDAIRDINKDIDLNYVVTFVPSKEDILEVTNKCSSRINKTIISDDN